MKKAIYIILFALLGVLFSFILHAVIELPTLLLLVKEGNIFGIELSWPEWYTLHRYGGMFLLILGTTLGLQQGVYWWNRLYTIEGRLRQKR